MIDLRSMTAHELAGFLGGIKVATAAAALAELAALAPMATRAITDPLILPNNVTEEVYQAHFPLRYNVDALTPFEAHELALDATVQQWIFRQAFACVSDKYGRIDIPAGFTTDFASVPARLQSVISACSPLILRPSGAHDWLYTRNGLMPDGKTRLTFEQVNGVLTELMFYCGAGPAIRAMVYEAVQIGGKSTWNSHNPPAGFEA